MSLTDRVAAAMYIAPDPADPDALLEPWPPTHPDDLAWWITRAQAAIDAILAAGFRRSEVVPQDSAQGGVYVAAPLGTAMRKHVGIDDPSTDPLRGGCAGFGGGISVEVPEPSTEAWSTEDRREALAEGLRRWSVQGQHDRVEQRDHDLYGMGARQGFALGAEWWKSTHAATESQGEPSDSDGILGDLVLRLNNESLGRDDVTWRQVMCRIEGVEAARAALRAASAITEQGENR